MGDSKQLSPKQPKEKEVTKEHIEMATLADEGSVGRVPLRYCQQQEGATPKNRNAWA